MHLELGGPLLTLGDIAGQGRGAAMTSVVQADFTSTAVGLLSDLGVADQ